MIRSRRSTAELGLELARTKDPDLILLDVMLPKMTALRSARI